MPSHREQGLPELAIGIGVHSGEAVIGTIGSQRRQKYTAIGKNVNLVARIESYTVGGQVLVSDSAYNEIGTIADTLGSFQLRAKGFTDPIAVHDIRGLAGEYNLQLPERRPDVECPGGAQANRSVDHQGQDHRRPTPGRGDRGRRRSTCGSAPKRPSLPFDDLMLDVAGSQAFVKVIECDSQEGVCDLFAVYTSVPGDVRRALAGVNGTQAVRPA